MKEKIFYILSIFSAVLTFGQVTLVAATEDREQKVNQRFNVTVMLEIAGENMEQETPLRMPDLSKFEVVGTASQQNTVVVDGKRGDVLNQMIYQLVLSPKQPGRVKFGSVLVTVNGKIYKTEPFDILVAEETAVQKKESLADNNSNDIYLNLELEEPSVYQNEPTVAVLRAYSRDFENFRKVRDIRFSNQANIDVQPVHVGRQEIESKSGWATQVIAMFIVFPEMSGNIVIKPATALLSTSGKSTKLVSNTVKLNVKKLPHDKPATFENAVGDFTLTVNRKDTAKYQEVEKPMNVSVKLSGKGNLNQIRLPKIIKSDDYIFYTPRFANNVTTERSNLSGDITADYILIPKKTGEIMVNLEDFVYFSPKENSYVNLGKKALLLNVMTPQQIAGAKSTLEHVNDYTNIVLETVGTPIMKTEQMKVQQGSGIRWLVVAGNLGLVGLILGIFYFFRKKITNYFAPKKMNTPLGSVSETEAELRKNLKPNLEDYFLYLNQLREDRQISKFFSVYDEMELEVRNHYRLGSESEMRQFIEDRFGISLAERFRELKQKIHIEKYAPLHSDEDISEIFEGIINIYKQIDK